MIEPGYCQCGCGAWLGHWQVNNAPQGIVKGKPKRFARGHHRRVGPSPEQRFWEKVFVQSEDECWEWQAGGGDYGRIQIDGRGASAHRFSYEIHNGPIPEGMFVCHACDNPGCVNPGHLFLGTQADNMADKVNKGRQASGPRNGNSKLTWDDIENIRANAMNLTLVELGELFGVSHENISFILRGETWKEKA